MQGDSLTDQIYNIRMKYTGRQQVKCRFSILVDNRMPCIGSSLKANDNIRFSCQQIRYFSLAFVSPVSSHNGLYHKFNLPLYLTSLLPDASADSTRLQLL